MNDTLSKPDEPTWGMRLNEGSYPIKNYPSWLNRFQRGTWNERGLIIWDKNAQQVTKIWASHALHLLDELRNSEKWKNDGIIIGDPAIRINIPSGKRNSKKHDQEKKDEGEWILTDQIQLSCNRTKELFEFLERNEVVLRRIADIDAEMRDKTLDKVYQIIFRYGQEIAARDVDISKRQLPWRFDNDSMQWMCDLPPNRGSVLLSENILFWRGCIERPDRLKNFSPYFSKIEDALDWIEKELLSLDENDDKDSAIEPDENKPRLTREERLPLILTPERRRMLEPYWISAADIKPKNISYHAFIVILAEPIRYKIIEISFGKKIQLPDEYLTPEQLAKELGLNYHKVHMDGVQGYHFITSSTVYYQEYIASSQAQKLWDESRILQKYQERRVKTANYGFLEKETGYRIYLGSCGYFDQNKISQRNRDEYMNWSALGETLINAMDLDAYRLYLNLSKDILSDDELLKALHEARSESPYIPKSARNLSIQWLREHEHLLDFPPGASQ